jgi:tetratricopeptide (TPR) repeat protein
MEFLLTLNILIMKRIILSFFILFNLSANAHRTEVDILETEAGKVAALSKIGGETGRYINKEKGIKILDTALILSFEIKNKDYREVVLALIANEYAGLGEIEKAINITQSISDVYIFVTNFGKIANKLVNSNPALAEKLLDEAIIKAKKEADKEDLPALLAELSGKYTRLQKVETARQLLKEANQMVNQLNDIHLDDRLSLYAEIAANMVAAGLKEEAFKLFDKAFELSSQLKDPFERVAILTMLGGELAEKGQPEKALNMLEEAFKICPTIENINKRNDVTSEIARNYSQSKNFIKAKEIAMTIEDGYLSWDALITTAKNHMKLKQLDDAYSILKIVEEKISSISVLEKKAMIMAKTAAELAELGRKDEAEKMLLKALKMIS